MAFDRDVRVSAQPRQDLRPLLADHRDALPGRIEIVTGRVQPGLRRDLPFGELRLAAELAFRAGLVGLGTLQLFRLPANGGLWHDDVRDDPGAHPLGPAPAPAETLRAPR